MVKYSSNPGVPSGQVASISCITFFAMVAEFSLSASSESDAMFGGAIGSVNGMSHERISSKLYVKGAVEYISCSFWLVSVLCEVTSICLEAALRY